MNRRGRLSVIRKKRKEIRAELVYFPHYLFGISVAVGGGTKEVSVACDGVSGNLAFLEMENLDFVDEADAHRLDFRIGREDAREKVLDEYQWILVKRGFHSKNPPQLEAVTETRRFYYPYWVAYYRRRGALDFRAVDAISCAPLGIRMRRAFLTAFAGTTHERDTAPRRPGGAERSL